MTKKRVVKKTSNLKNDGNILEIEIIELHEDEEKPGNQEEMPDIEIEQSNQQLTIAQECTMTTEHKDGKTNLLCMTSAISSQSKARLVLLLSTTNSLFIRLISACWFTGILMQFLWRALEDIACKNN